VTIDSLRAQLLDTRDARAAAIARLCAALPGGHALVFLSLNVPGPDKTSPRLDRLFRRARTALEREAGALRRTFTLQRSADGPSQPEEGRDALGPWLAVPCAGRAHDVKRRCVELEESLAGGRLLDIDVFDRRGRQVGRRSLALPPRRCLACTEAAVDCIRTGRHAGDDLTAAVSRLLLAGECAQVADALVQGARIELELTPKPGLVDRLDNGSHQDLSFELMARSIDLLPTYYDDLLRLAGLKACSTAATGALDGSGAGLKIRSAATGALDGGGAGLKIRSAATGALDGSGAGLKIRSAATGALDGGATGLRACSTADKDALVSGGAGLQPCPLDLQACIAAGRRAEQRMLDAIGANAHRGYIFLSGVVLLGFAEGGRPADGLRASVASVAQRSVGARAGSSTTHGDEARRRHRVGGVLGEALNGLPSVFDHGLPALDRAEARFGPSDAARHSAMAALMTVVEDTTTLHRCGAVGLERLRRDGRQILKAIEVGPDYLALLTRLNEDYRAAGLTMGGVADCLAITMALKLIEQA
jgi:holo-ACP synthase CitX